MGFVWSRGRDYRLALLYPVIVLGLAALIAWITSAINLQNTDVLDAALRIAVTVLVTIPLAIITEEGFFRGWLWASLKRAGQNKVGILVFLIALWQWYRRAGTRLEAPEVPAGARLHC